jgi:hypothetical protein
MSQCKTFETFKLSRQESARFSESLGNERLLTRQQAAQFLFVSPRTLDSWCANMRAPKRRRKPRGVSNVIQASRERLPYVKLGHKVFFMLGDLRRFRDERKIAA